MKKMILLSCACITLLLTGCNDTTSLDSDLQKQSYSYGYFIGEDLVNKDAQLDSAALIAGIQDGLNNMQQLSDEDIQDALRALEAAVREKYAEKMTRERVENLEKSEQFLA